MKGEIAEKLVAVHAAYPPRLREHESMERPSFHIRLVLDRLGRVPSSMVDLGGGYGPVSVGFAALGARAVLVDDFGDPINEQLGEGPLAVHRSYGVEVVSTNVLELDLRDLGPFDAVTSFDSMEHWHDSPKRLFHSAVEALNPGGVFVLGVPNAANLRKRLTVPLGRASWSPMGEWYERDRFRGHVREPNVRDLRYIAKDIGLRDVEILGRNWLGYYSHPRLTRIFDRPLRPFPSLCSDIYLIGRR
jgi:SAM-dependent methyltransferase